MNEIEAQQYLSALDIVPDPVIVIQADGSIVYVNLQAEKCFGYTRQELQNQQLEILLPNRFRHSHVENRAQFLQNPIARPMGTGLKLFGKRKDGFEFPVDITIGSMAVGSVLLLVSIVRDISEKRKIEIERDRALEAKENLLAMITHDLKNPLLAIKLSADLLDKRLQSNDDTAPLTDFVERIRSAALRMQRLIEDYLTSKKLDGGVFVIEARPIGIASLVDEIFNVMAPIASRRSIRLEKEIETSGECNCDLSRMRQVFFNLIDNAIKFTSPGGTIKFHVSLREGKALFSISDTGRGIAKEDIPKLFSRYSQTKQTAAQGTGLGLFIAKSIIEAHGGKIWIESTLGKGSTFFVMLPLIKTQFSNNNFVSDEAGHYDIDGISFDEQRGVIVASDAIPFAA